MKFSNINYKRTFAISAFIVSGFASYGQYVKDLKRSADEYYAKGDYYSAAIYYEKFLTGGDKGKDGSTEPYTIQKKGAAKNTDNSANAGNDAIVWRIAESYRSLNDYTNAEKWYAQAVKFDKNVYPNAAYYYAVSLRANGKYAEAQQQLESFIGSSKQAAYIDLAKQELADVKYIQEQLKRTDGNLYNVAKLNTQRNSAGADYAAIKSGNSVYFTSTRADSALAGNKKKSPFVNALYKMEEGGAAEKVSLPTANMEQGVAALTPDGNRLFLTRWVNKQGQNLASIYTSEKTATGWSEPVKLNAQVNSDEFSTQQPFVTADGKYLLFASNRPGGAGKFDLYYAPLQANGEVGKATNLGRTINTKEDDQSPFYHQGSGTLVFASKGRVGMGGYDLYASKGTIGGTWTEVENLGYPVNSNKDDLYFFTASNNKILQDASISSDRASACCLELFAVNKVYKKYIAGTVTDCNTNQPIATANAQLSIPSKLVSAVNGRFVFEVNDFTAAQLSASKASYKNGSAYLALPTSDVDTLFASVCLTPEEVIADPQPPAKTPTSVLFEFAMYELRPETKVTLDTLGALLLREPMLMLELVGYTDKKGSDGYNKQLSELRANECKKYLLAKGIPADRLKVTAMGECCPVEKEVTKDGKDNPQARQANRRVEFKILLR